MDRGLAARGRDCGDWDGDLVFIWSTLFFAADLWMISSLTGILLLVIEGTELLLRLDLELDTGELKLIDCLQSCSFHDFTKIDK